MIRMTRWPLYGMVFDVKMCVVKRVGLVSRSVSLYLCQKVLRYAVLFSTALLW